jgi:hypothetical protein
MTACRSPAARSSSLVKIRTESMRALSHASQTQRRTADVAQCREDVCLYRVGPRRLKLGLNGRSFAMAIPIDRVENTEDMHAWEYMTFDLAKPKRDIDDLNRLGRDGWEAVSMVSSWGVGWRFVHPIVLLRRQLSDVGR